MAGDKVVQPSDDSSEGVTMEQIRNKDAKAISFYTSLKVESATVLCRGAYIDNHEFFSGFGDLHQNVKFNPHPPPESVEPDEESLHTMSLRIAKINNELKEAHVPARKITCMSARRDQIEAAGR